MEETNRADIRIDKDGVWHYRGREMFRRDIVQFLSRRLRQDAAGRYLIAMNGEVCLLDVEDTPLVVRAVTRTSLPGEGEALALTLSDGTKEILDPDTLRVGPGHVLYCTVREGAFPARLSRPAYYQVAAHIAGDEESGGFSLVLNNRRHAIGRAEAREIHQGGTPC